jgi:hypothetical protein
MGFVRKLTGGKDAKKAAQTSAAASDRATQMQWDMFNQSRNDLAPYRQTGVDALGQMARLYGMPQYGADGKQVAAAGPADYSAFQDSPDYQFSFDEGNRAVNAGLAARGLSNSGRAMKELTRYGQGMASQQLGNYVNRLAAMAGVGQTATNQTGNLGANAATNAGQTTQAAGDARASGYMARAGQNQQLYGQLLNMGMGSGLGALGGMASGTGAGMGALMGLLSDRNEKKDIKKVGKTKDGLNVYTYKYKRDPRGVTHMGVMHQEVMKKKPEAGLIIDGVKGVDYARVS